MNQLQGHSGPIGTRKGILVVSQRGAVGGKVVNCGFWIHLECSR